jgi:mRNA interferase MazF
MSPASYNWRVGLAVFCPVTSRIKGYPFEVELPYGLAVSGVVLSDQVKSLDWRARHVQYACEAPKEVVDQVLERLSSLLSR